MEKLKAEIADCIYEYTLWVREEDEGYIRRSDVEDVAENIFGILRDNRVELPEWVGVLGDAWPHVVWIKHARTGDAQVEKNGEWKLFLSFDIPHAAYTAAGETGFQWGREASVEEAKFAVDCVFARLDALFT